VREERQFYIEERTFADAPDYRGHAGASIYIATRLGTIFFVNDYDRIPQRGWQDG
jgi:hypothetical protein